MNTRICKVMAAALVAGSLAMSQNQPAEKPPASATQSANELADALAQRLSSDLHVKTVVGEPIKAGTVTLIPIMMIEINFGGAGTASPGGPAAAAALSPVAGVDGFIMSGEARPLGFVAISKSGTRFISVAKTPGK